MPDRHHPIRPPENTRPPSGTFWTGKHCRKRPPAETGTPGKKQILRETMTTGKNGHTRTDTNDRPLWPRPRQPDARQSLPADTTPAIPHLPAAFPALSTFSPPPLFRAVPGGSGQLRPPAFSSPATSPDTGFSAPTLLRYYLPEKIHKKTGQTWKNRHAGRFFPPVSPSHGRSRHWTMKTTS